MKNKHIQAGNDMIIHSLVYKLTKTDNSIRKEAHTWLQARCIAISLFWFHLSLVTGRPVCAMTVNFLRQNGESSGFSTSLKSSLYCTIMTSKSSQLCHYKQWCDHIYHHL